MTIKEAIKTARELSVGWERYAGACNSKCSDDCLNTRAKELVKFLKELKTKEK